MTVLEVRDLLVQFGVGRHAMRAVDGVSLTVTSGHVVGLVGESGSGKSTLAKAIVGLAPIRGGAVLWNGEVLRSPHHKGRRTRRGDARRVQYIFQDPYASLDPRMSVGDSIAEGFTTGAGRGRGDRRADVEKLLDLVHLDPECMRSLPRHLSGGQRQRVAIARALAARPDILIADEVTSSLDVSVQGAVLNVLREVQRETGIGMLFISHNLAVVRYLADTIAVMHLGRLTEAGPAEEITVRPTEAYTRELLAAVPMIRRREANGQDEADSHQERDPQHVDVAVDSG
jgi:peptide/nickel transport system ATP-binding protein